MRGCEGGCRALSEADADADAHAHADADGPWPLAPTAGTWCALSMWLGGGGGDGGDWCACTPAVSFESPRLPALPQTRETQTRLTDKKDGRTRFCQT